MLTFGMESGKFLSSLNRLVYLAVIYNDVLSSFINPSLYE